MARILVIDDDEQLQRMLKLTLQVLGYDVDQAFDGKAGVTLCRTSPPDIVLTDILMPNQDGLETIRELRRACPDVKIIAMSGGSESLTGIDALPFAARFGARRVLYKPFNHKELSTALHEAGSA
ncbi:MAG TPA: response regulator [Gemmataceae bacterium]|nr:response regulator [Gemmataceae bacterium]